MWLRPSLSRRVLNILSIASHGRSSASVALFHGMLHFGTTYVSEGVILGKDTYLRHWYQQDRCDLASCLSSLFYLTSPAAILEICDLEMPEDYLKLIFHTEKQGRIYRGASTATSFPYLIWKTWKIWRYQSWNHQGMHTGYPYLEILPQLGLFVRKMKMHSALLINFISRPVKNVTLYFLLLS